MTWIRRKTKHPDVTCYLHFSRVGTLTCEALTLQAVLSNAPQMSCLDPSHNEGVCDQSLARRIEQHETLGREEIPARTGILWARMTRLGIS